VSLSDYNEVNLFWAAYDRALQAHDRELIRTPLVRQALEAIAELEERVHELELELGKAVWDSGKD